MLDQHLRMLFQIAEARRMHGTSDRDGTIHQVWRQGHEQKVRVNVGKRPDGSPWLTPWIKIEAHHGALREQQKFHKGQNVKLSAAGADFSYAKVTPAGENKAHPEPQHADDIHETTQYAAVRKRIGPDFQEQWLAKDSGSSSSGSSVNLSTILGIDSGGGGFGGGGASGTWTDPDKDSVAVVRMGAKPDKQEDKNQPWDGPDPNQGNPKKRHLKWAGKPGDTPQQTGDVITTQFGKDVKTEHTDTNILNKVQSGGESMASPDSGDGSAQRVTSDNMKDADILRKIHDLASQLTTSSGHTSGSIIHIVMDMAGNIATKALQKNQIIHQLQDAQGNFSSIVQQAEQVIHQVTGSGGTSTLQITGSAINLNSKSVQINTDTISTPSTPPDIPQVNSSGDAPLIAFPTQWSIAADLPIEARIPIRWPISSKMVIH